MIKTIRTVMTAALACGTLSPAMFAEGIEPLGTVRVASGLDFPVWVGHAPNDFEHLYFLEKRGKIRVMNLLTGVVNPTPVLDIDSLVAGGTTTNDERGLLGLAFDPDYGTNGFIYVNYTAPATTVRRYTMTTPEVADPDSASPLLTISQPFTNHNGGWMAFGPNDGYLYIGTGDGGSGGDPGDRAQDITNQLLGKMLRIDPLAGGGYGIPASNPFVDITGDDEIWAYGLRNPWRSSFDRLTGDLWIADVGQNTWEELNVQPGDSTGGENYGWRCREGMHNFNTADCPPLNELVEPLFEYGHSCTDGGFSITGGFVYRGCAIPSLRGNYIFSDYACQNFWIATLDGKTLDVVQSDSSFTPSQDGFSVNQVSSFGEDAHGELYIVDQGSATTGAIFRVIPITPTIRDADVNCDGVVDFQDLLNVLGEWGDCPGCRSDVNASRTTDFQDVLEVLSKWD